MVILNVNAPPGCDLTDSRAANSADSPAAAKGGDNPSDLAQLLTGLVQKRSWGDPGWGGSGEQGNGLADLVSRLEPQLAPRNLLNSATDTDSNIIGP